MKITQDIRDFLEHEGKALIVEDGEPRFVLARFHDYMRLVRGGREFSQPLPKHADTHPQRTSERDREVAEINRELEALTVDDFFLQQESAATRENPGALYKEP